MDTYGRISEVGARFFGHLVGHVWKMLGGLGDVLDSF